MLFTKPAKTQLLNNHHETNFSLANKNLLMGHFPVNGP